MSRSKTDEPFRSESEFDLQLSGTSMTPTIRDREFVRVQQVDPEELQTGDVLLAFGRDRSLIAHRVVRFLTRSGSTVIKTRGDANPKRVERLSGDRVIGKITHVRTEGHPVRMDSFPQKAWTLFMLCFSPFFARFYAACAGMFGSTDRTGIVQKS